MPPSTTSESVPTTARADAIERAVQDHVTHTLARDPAKATERDLYMAFAWSVRDRLAKCWAETQARYEEEDAKRVYYLSLEFLLGRTLGNALINLDLKEAGAEALEELGYQLEDLQEREPDAGLGNGGLGRLAACYLDSMATIGVPGYGYGIRYEHGIFRQRIVNREQVELPDNWLRDANPWEIIRPDRAYPVKFYGRVESHLDNDGRSHFSWVDTQDVLAMAYDMPIPGYRNQTVNTLRLWGATATKEFDLQDFIRGDYIAAVNSKMESETISKVLYPPDDTGRGKELRLKQQFFFVTATLQDILRRFKRGGGNLIGFPDKAQIQLNDTHPAIAIPELMRLLMDEEGCEWDEAWDIVRRTFAYTNHTVLPEALESWSVELMGRLLPRHLDIIGEIDRRFRATVAARFPDDAERPERMAIVSGGRVRMANLAIVGSHSVNGVAALHSRLLRERIFRDFYELYPERFTSVTNGITQRRFILKANPQLSDLVTEAIGDGWVTDLPQLRALEPFVDDAEFRDRWWEIKASNKRALAEVVLSDAGVRVDADGIFDVQIKRIHEYKRQLLNALRLADLYLELKDDPALDVHPRAVLFGGKAAPTYAAAKQVIHLINAIAATVNADRRVRETLQVAFLPDYRVSLAVKIIPGTDLSEQISTAGYEASGTGNMKLALNGALTIGTLDGANIEIAEAVGEENIFLFGLTAEEVVQRKAEGYDPRAVYEANPRVRRVLDFVGSALLTPGEPGLFRPLVEGLLEHDPYLVLADFDDYLRAQAEVDMAYRDSERWTRMSILNVARCGHFSSDRSVREYMERIWKL